MITSKQDLKKHIARINDDIVKYILPEAVLRGTVTEEKAAEALTKLAELTHEARTRIAVAFDKTPKAFDSMTAYKKARKAYFSEAYAKALTAYEEQVNKLLSDLAPAK